MYLKFFTKTIETISINFKNMAQRPDRSFEVVSVRGRSLRK